VTHFNSALFPPIAAVRLLQKLLPKRGEPSSDTQDTHPLINTALTRLFGAERHLVGKVPMPFGVSIMALARAA
jgi:hypothetical protein